MDLEYLTKDEAKPKKKIFIDKADQIILEAKKEFSICFALVGSSKRNMILINANNKNARFDFDYQLLIKKYKFDDPKKVKEYFLKLFREQFKKVDGWKVQDSTSAITIKNNDKQYTYDVAIIKMNSQTLKQNILKHYKEEKNVDHTYSWEEISEYKQHKLNLRTIKGKDHWDCVRDLYKDKKSNNWSDIKSYLLFIEAVKETAEKFK